MEELMIPVLALRGMMVLPGMVTNLDVGRDRSIKAVNLAMKNNRRIFLVAQRDAVVDNPQEEDLFDVGVVAEVKQMLKLPSGALRVLVEGLDRARLVKLEDKANLPFKGYIDVIEDVIDEEPQRIEALKRMVIDTFEQWVVATQKVKGEGMLAFKDEFETGRIADLITGHLDVELAEKAEILKEGNVATRLELLYKLLCKEVEIAIIEKDIALKVKEQIEQNQKEYYLREQMKVISEELNDGDEKQAEIKAYRKRMAELDIPENVLVKLNKELDRMAKMPPMMPETAVIRNYMDMVLDLPWNNHTEDNYDLELASKILDKDHYGLTKVKKRILEYLAVRALTQSAKGPILCLVGPPGVGKTSLAHSIAKAVNRKFTRISLGGVRDEAEIRGHRRTYIGAMPGRIIHGMQTCGSSNPVFLLDEVDKMASDFRGDPASALLEVLDPEQNNTFSDHFIEFPYDLSHVFWIVTANTAETIPPALLDRMEVIQLVSYTEEEKAKIASLHLLPKEREANGLTGKNFTLAPTAIPRIIRDYTREAGVRTLEKKIAAVCRKAAYEIVTGKNDKVKVNAKNLTDYLGPIIYLEEDMRAESAIGICSGLAWTSVGGEMLKVEVVASPGKGKLQLTGQLGDVMKESAQAAYTYIRSRVQELGLDPEFAEKVDIHIHLPEGAIPKDGPSAGITMATAMISALTKRKVQADVAMTGEITLSGRVLPVGGIKEKMLAAARYRIKKVLMPVKNIQDLDELPENIKNNMEFIPVAHMDDVLKLALEEAHGNN